MSEVSSLTTEKGDVRPFILLTSLPMPPSSNNQYILVRRGRKTFHAPSKELKQFKTAMLGWAFKEAGKISSDKMALIDWMSSGLVIECRAVFFFHKRILFTKKNSPKKMDVSNRIKACHDEVCKILGIDDSLFFKITAEKAICHDNLQEMCCIEMVPTVV